MSFSGQLKVRKKRGIKPAKSKYFNNCSKAAIFIAGRNENIRFRQLIFFCCFFPLSSLAGFGPTRVDAGTWSAVLAQLWRDTVLQKGLNGGMKYFPAPGTLLGVPQQGKGILQPAGLQQCLDLVMQGCKTTLLELLPRPLSLL